MASKTPAELATEFGFSEGFFRSDNELWTLFNKAKGAQWSPTKFQSEFMKTSWYRQRQASIRQWSDLEIRDPAEAESKITGRIADLSDQFTQMGLQPDDNLLRSLATQSLKYAWSNSQLQNVLSSYVQYVPGQTGGSIAGMETHIKDLAYQYGVSVTNEQVQDWVQGMVSQKYTDENVTDFVRDAAKSKYAGLAPQLDSGRSVRDIAGQHIAEMSRLLEVDPGSVSLDDPIMANALQGTIDPQTNMPVTQTVFQMSQAVKRDSRWLKTKNARDEMVNAATAIGRDMGLI